MRRRASLIFLLATAVIGSLCLPAPSAAKTSSRAKIKSQGDALKNYSYWQIAEVVDYLATLQDTDGEGHAPKILSCDPSLDAARDVFSGELHAIADGSRRAEVEHYLKDPSIYTKRIASCGHDCNCDGIAMVIADAELNLSENTVHQKNKAAVEESIKKQSPDHPLECARKTKWFCGSGLQRYLFPPQAAAAPSAAPTQPSGSPGGK